MTVTLARYRALFVSPPMIFHFLMESLTESSGPQTPDIDSRHMGIPYMMKPASQKSVEGKSTVLLYK